ncbi:MAG: hypothetical protein C4325_05310 [Blastocatellia bacterium]
MNEITEERKAYAIERLNSLPLARAMGIRLVDIRPNEAVMTIEFRADLSQPSGILHGGVTATLIDTAMAFAVRTRLPDDVPTATIDLTVHYLRPHAKGTATCLARVLRAGQKIFTVTAEVKNEEGKLIATALSTYARI